MKINILVLAVCMAVSGGRLYSMDGSDTVSTHIAPPGQFPLHKAIAFGYVEEVKLLVSNGSPLELRDNDERTPLQAALLSSSTASKAQRLEMASILIANGANMEAVEHEMVAPLLFALIKKVDVQGVALLLRYGANPSSTNLKGVRALMYADSKCAKTNNPDAQKISELLGNYIGRLIQPDFADLIQTPQERKTLCEVSHQAVLASLKKSRELLEAHMRLQEVEKAALEIALANRLLRTQLTISSSEIIDN